MTTYTAHQCPNRWPGFIVLILIALIYLIAWLTTGCTLNTEYDQYITFTQDEIYRVDSDHVYFHKDSTYTGQSHGIINYQAKKNKINHMRQTSGQLIFSCPTVHVKLKSITLTPLDHATTTHQSKNPSIE